VIADAGVVVGENDEAGWLQAIVDLRDSSQRRQELAAKGLARVREHYTWPMIARRHLEFWDELLERGPSR
jgi:glycosyltransferase involved in cell wall biosynthesis